MHLTWRSYDRRDGLTRQQGGSTFSPPSLPRTLLSTYSSTAQWYVIRSYCPAAALMRTGAGYVPNRTYTGAFRSRFYGLRLMVKEARNERKGVEAWMDLYTLYCRMAYLFRPPKWVKSICFGRIRLRFILSFSVVPAEIVQADVIVVCDLLQFS